MSIEFRERPTLEHVFQLEVRDSGALRRQNQGSPAPGTMQRFVDMKSPFSGTAVF